MRRQAEVVPGSERKGNYGLVRLERERCGPTYTPSAPRDRDWHIIHTILTGRSNNRVSIFWIQA